MHEFINSPLTIGSLRIPHRLIQGPLAGYSCAPFRVQFSHYVNPAYCVSEMCSAIDVLDKHKSDSRYVYRAPEESLLAYQISGIDADIMSAAALKLESLGANLIDINCGCPKLKIRKKGAGSALLETPERLLRLVETIKKRLTIPLTVKIRIQTREQDLWLAKAIESSGADALIVHGRRWMDDYDIPCDYEAIARIKSAVTIPVIANGDVTNSASLNHALKQTGCDAFMIARAGTGKPWLYQELLSQKPVVTSLETRIYRFMDHIRQLAALEHEYQALMQSRTLVRYYFRADRRPEFLEPFYAIECIDDIPDFLHAHCTRL